MEKEDITFENIPKDILNIISIYKPSYLIINEGITDIQYGCQSKFKNHISYNIDELLNNFYHIIYEKCGMIGEKEFYKFILDDNNYFKIQKSQYKSYDIYTKINILIQLDIKKGNINFNINKNVVNYIKQYYFGQYRICHNYSLILSQDFIIKNVSYIINSNLFTL